MYKGDYKLYQEAGFKILRPMHHRDGYWYIAQRSDNGGWLRYDSYEYKERYMAVMIIEQMARNFPHVYINDCADESVEQTA